MRRSDHVARDWSACVHLSAVLLFCRSGKMCRTLSIRITLFPHCHFHIYFQIKLRMHIWIFPDHTSFQITPFHIFPDEYKQAVRQTSRAAPETRTATGPGRGHSLGHSVNHTHFQEGTSPRPTGLRSSASPVGLLTPSRSPAGLTPRPPHHHLTTPSRRVREVEHVRKHARRRRARTSTRTAEDQRVVRVPPRVK